MTNTKNITVKTFASIADKVAFVKETLLRNESWSRLFRAKNVKVDGATREYRAIMDTKSFKDNMVLVKEFGSGEIGSVQNVRYFNMETATLLEVADEVIILIDATTIKRMTGSAELTQYLTLLAAVGYIASKA